MTKVRKLQIVLYIILILGCIGLYLYGVIVKQADPQKNLMEMLLVIAGCILGLFRGNRRSGRSSLAFYEKSYQNEIGQAFATDAKNRKQLLGALRDYNENKLKKASVTLEQLKDDCRVQDDYYAVGLFLALCYTEMGLFEAAIKEYDVLIAHRLENSRIYNNLGHVYAKLGRNAQAMENYEKALSLSPENEYAYINIANLSFGDGDFETAVTYAKKALEINSKLKQAANLLAIVYAIRDDKENADKYFHVALACGSDPAELKNAIAYYKTK